MSSSVVVRNVYVKDRVRNGSYYLNSGEVGSQTSTSSLKTTHGFDFTYTDTVRDETRHRYYSKLTLRGLCYLDAVYTGKGHSQGKSIGHLLKKGRVLGCGTETLESTDEYPESEKRRQHIYLLKLSFVVLSIVITHKRCSRI